MIRNAICLIGMIGLLAGCANRQTTSLPEPLRISCAASTRELVADWVDEFTKQVEVELNDPSFQINAGPTNALATQIINGAEFDLFLSANRDWAEKVVAAGSGRTAIPFLANRLVLIVPAQSTLDCNHPNDLPQASLTVLALAGENVPAGVYADQALERSGVITRLLPEQRIIRASDVRAAVMYVERGEADAAIVYATDAFGRPDVRVAFVFDTVLHDPIEYHLVRRSDSPPQLEKFLDFLRSESAQSILQRHGFASAP